MAVRAARQSGPMRRRTAFALACALVLALALPAGSAEEEKDARKNFVPSEQVGKRLLRAAELAEQEKYGEAAALLEPLTRRERMAPFDKAAVFQLYGTMLAADEKYAPAIAALETSLAVDYLPASAMQDLRYNLAQLHLVEENFPRTIELLKAWLSHATKPTAQVHFLIAAAYAQTEKWKEALPHARQVVALTEKPSEQQLVLLLAVEFQNGNLPESLGVMKQLVSRYPKKRYFMQLAAGYSSTGEEDKALAMLELADVQGWLDRDTEIVQLAQRYLFAELPWPAARALERGFAKGIVPRTPDNLELYANALLTAREYQKALAPLEEAAEHSEDGDLYVRLAQVQLETENWDAAARALKTAVARGGLDQPGNAQLLLGIVSFKQARFDAARSAFRNALADDRTADTARKWLDHVERAERERATQM